jgi:hypothetical protein
VLSGVLHDANTGEMIEIRRTTFDDVPVDHILPLAEAPCAGASAWIALRRETFANDAVEPRSTGRTVLPVRTTYEDRATIARRECFSGRPPVLTGGRRGSISSHCLSLVFEDTGLVASPRDR